MNGRVYDPLLARFGTPDPTTESPFSTQGWNRYSYVGNSPLNFTDPSGYCFLGCFWQPIFAAIQNLFRSVPLIGSIVQIAAGVLCAGPLAPLCVGLAAAVVTGITSGKLGLALKAGFISAVTAFAFTAVGDLTGRFEGADPIRGGHGPLQFGSDAHLFNIAGHALVGCASATANGGKCGSGALSGAAGSFAGPLLSGFEFSSKLVATSVLGGLASVAGGGKFANGAVTAAFGYLFNEALTPPKGAPVWPHNDPYVPFDELPESSRQILQYRTFVYDAATATWRVQFTFPWESEITPTIARRGEGAGTEQSGYVVTPPGSPPVVPETNPLSALRLGFSTPFFSGPYFVVYNESGQPISPATGQTVPRPLQHYPLDPVRTFMQPR
jgi:hypothetical protein